MAVTTGITGLVSGSSQRPLRTSSGSALNVPARRKIKNTRKGNTNRIETMQKHILDCFGLKPSMNTHGTAVKLKKKKIKKAKIMADANF